MKITGLYQNDAKSRRSCTRGEILPPLVVKKGSMLICDLSNGIRCVRSPRLGYGGPLLFDRPQQHSTSH